jgi:hypothetical protein
MTAPEELDDWMRELAQALRISGLELDIPLVLDLARDAAHGVARPAAPLTAFLVGYAAGCAGGTPTDIRASAATALRLLEQRTGTEPPEG